MSDNCERITQLEAGLRAIQEECQRSLNCDHEHDECGEYEECENGTACGHVDDCIGCTITELARAALTPKPDAAPPVVKDYLTTAHDSLPRGPRGDAGEAGMTKRDPRVDPKPGDVLRRDGLVEPFTVKRVDNDGHIAGHFRHGMTGSLCTLPWWRNTFAKNAEVIHASE